MNVQLSQPRHIDEISTPNFHSGNGCTKASHHREDKPDLKPGPLQADCRRKALPCHFIGIQGSTELSVHRGATADEFFFGAPLLSFSCLEISVSAHFLAAAQSDCERLASLLEVRGCNLPAFARLGPAEAKCSTLRNGAGPTRLNRCRACQPRTGPLR